MYDLSLDLKRLKVSASTVYFGRLFHSLTYLLFHFRAHFKAENIQKSEYQLTWNNVSMNDVHKRNVPIHARKVATIVSTVVLPFVPGSDGCLFFMRVS